MIVDDLNFVEDITTESIEGAGGGYYSPCPPAYPCYPSRPNYSFTERLDISKKIKTRVDLQGSLANLDFDNSAYGKNTLAESLLYNSAVAGKSSHQYGSMVAAATGKTGGYYGHC
jgi:hypothetical protein